MSWKIVRDKNEAWCREHGVPGQWRRSPRPGVALLRKVFEELGEYAEQRDPAELCDLRDVILRLAALTDPDGAVRQAHQPKGIKPDLFILGARAGAYAEFRDPDDLYDLLDGVDLLLSLADPDAAVRGKHREKVAEMGGFEHLVEWCPVPEGQGGDE